MPTTTAKDLAGQQFGKLTVIERAEGPDPKRAFWRCRCECGETTVKMGKYLLNGDTQSCGCDQKAMRQRGNAKYGDLLARQHRKEYSAWRSMKSRCLVRSSSNFADYGGRGITVCDRWRDDFSAFLADVGPAPSPEHSIDRIDPNGHYTPENCRWVTWAAQHMNKRTTLLVQYQGETIALAEAARRAGVEYQAAHHRVTTHGETFEQAVAHLQAASLRRSMSA